MTTVSVSAHVGATIPRVAKPAPTLGPAFGLKLGLALGLALAIAALRSAPAFAADGPDASDASDVVRWGEIRSSLFGERTVGDGSGVIALETPYRAMDAAVVPIEVKSLIAQTPERFIEKLYLVIDMNPSPVAAVFHFSGRQGWESLATRVRVNAYTDVRAIAETSDGQLYMTSNFVKAAGGCSAPSLKDPAAAAAQRGRMKLLLPDKPHVGSPITAQILIKHPNSSGLQFDQISREFIPADFVRKIEVTYRGEPLFSVDSDISISEDPSVRFNLVPETSGEIRVQATDSNGRTYEQTFDVAATQDG